MPILTGVFSVTSIFSELTNGATCFALVPHLPHKVRCSLQLLGIGLDDDIDNYS